MTASTRMTGIATISRPGHSMRLTLLHAGTTLSSRRRPARPRQVHPGTTAGNKRRRPSEGALPASRDGWVTIQPQAYLLVPSSPRRRGGGVLLDARLVRMFRPDVVHHVLRYLVDHGTASFHRLHRHHPPAAGIPSRRRHGCVSIRLQRGCRRAGRVAEQRSWLQPEDRRRRLTAPGRSAPTPGRRRRRAVLGREHDRIGRRAGDDRRPLAGGDPPNRLRPPPSGRRTGLPGRRSRCAQVHAFMNGTLVVK